METHKFSEYTDQFAVIIDLTIDCCQKDLIC